MSAIMSSSNQLGPLFLPFFFFGRFRNQEMVLARYFYRRSILQRTLKQFWTSSSKIRTKIEMKEHLSGRLTSQTSLFRSRDMFVRSAFQFVFLPSNLAVFLWNPPWNSFYTVENPHLAWCLPRRLIKLSAPNSAPNWTCTRAHSVWIFQKNPEAETMLNMLLKTSLKIEQENTERRRRGKEKN